jgi:thymidylate synthase (FAD)
MATMEHSVNAATDQIDVLDHGFVRLDACMADDLSVVNSARVSFAQHSSEMTEREEGLIRFLIRERHGSPTEHNAFRFHIKCPIFVAREWMRHRAGSYNEHSARYSELPDEFYVPAADDVRTQVGKPGSYSFEPVDETTAEATRETLTRSYRASYDVYRNLIDKGVAREIARMALPVGIYTQFHWTLNARSLMNFLSLRNADTAQLEIRRFAEAVESIFAEHMPVTHAAFVEFDRRAP